MSSPHAPWTERERDAQNTVNRENIDAIRQLQIELAVVKTKIGMMSAVFGLAGAAVGEVIKLLMHH